MYHYKRSSLHVRAVAVLAVAATLAGLLAPRWMPAPAAVHAASRPAPRALAASPKPDWRGADLGNTGRLGVTGPAIPPAQSFNVKPAFAGATAGIELAPDNGVFFTLAGGILYKYTATGSKLWQFPSSGTLGSYGNNPNASGSNPVVSTDGAVYIGNDNGNLYQLDSTNGTGSSIFSSVANAPIYQTPKIGLDNSLYVGANDGKFYRLTPPTLGAGTLATPVYTFTASGSKQTSGTYAGTTSTAPFYFYGEAALDSVGNAYLASSDTNPAASARLGTLYKVTPAGTAAWAKPLQGEPVGAVVYATNPLTPSEPLVIVADKAPEITAFDSSTGSQVWDYLPSDVNAFVGSPIVSNGVLYIANNGDNLYALNVATGQPVNGFGIAGVLALSNGSASGPVVDAAGNIVIEGNGGTLQALNTTTGATLWTIAPGTGTGNSGSTGPRYMSPAIGSDGTLYVGGNSTIVRGFKAAAASIVASPTAGTFKTVVTVTGTNFGASEPISLYLDTPGTPLSSTVSTAGGAFAATFLMAQAISGTHSIVALGLTTNITATAHFQMRPGTFLAHYQSHQNGQNVLRGAGFAAHETVLGYFNSIGGKPLTVTATTNSIGTFGGGSTNPGITFTVPMSPAGSYKVYAVGQSSHGVGASTLTITPFLRVSPSSGPPGTAAQVIGTGYGAGEQVPIKYNCGTINCSSTIVLATATTDSHGDFTQSVTIPTVTGMGAHALGAKGATSGVFATTTFNVT